MPYEPQRGGPFRGDQQRGGYRGGGPPRQPADERTLDEIWPDYLRDGYFDAQGNLLLEFVSRDTVEEQLVKPMSQAHPPLTIHQLRRFFQHCRAIEARLKQSAADPRRERVRADARGKLATAADQQTDTVGWESERAAFYKLDSAAADAFGKSEKKIPRLFHDFIRRNVAAVKTRDDFLKGFLPHFEAVVGFGAQHFKERDRK